MNKRMRKFANKAGFIVENKKVFADDCFENINDQLDAYTELVIKECVKAIQRTKNDPLTELAAFHRVEHTNTTAKDYMIAIAEDIEREIKKHFGVK
jgi:hypothetical protein